MFTPPWKTLLILNTRNWVATHIIVCRLHLVTKRGDATPENKFGQNHLRNKLAKTGTPNLHPHKKKTKPIETTLQSLSTDLHLIKLRINTLLKIVPNTSFSSSSCFSDICQIKTHRWAAVFLEIYKCVSLKSVIASVKVKLSSLAEKIDPLNIICSDKTRQWKQWWEKNTF